MTCGLWHVILLSCSTLSISAHPNPAGNAEPEKILYEEIKWPEEQPSYEVFYEAIVGYERFQDSLHLFKKPLITIIDFSRPSIKNRLWVIDLDNRIVLFNTLVAHGRNSGDVMATRFSNKHESFQSSPGFYNTGETYIGKHGLSLLLEGLEHGINDQASSRAIVVHGADYVSERFVKNAGRLGRSLGCPAVSMDVYKQLIETIKHQTCLFIYAPVGYYHQQSKLIRKQVSAESLAFHPKDMIERF